MSKVVGMSLYCAKKGVSLVKTEYGDLVGYMHHQADSITKLCQTEWEGNQVYDSSSE